METACRRENNGHRQRLPPNSAHLRLNFPGMARRQCLQPTCVWMVYRPKTMWLVECGGIAATRALSRGLKVRRTFLWRRLCAVKHRRKSIAERSTPDDPVRIAT